MRKNRKNRGKGIRGEDGIRGFRASGCSMEWNEERSLCEKSRRREIGREEREKAVRKEEREVD